MTAKLITFKTNHTILAEVDADEANNKLFETFKVKKPVQVIVKKPKTSPKMSSKSKSIAKSNAK